MPITFSMRYTPENLQRAFLLHYRKLNPVRGRIIQILGFLLIWAGLLLMLIYRNQEQRIIQYVYMVTGVVLIIVHSYLMSRLGRMTFKRMKSPQGSFDFRIDETQIEMVTTNGTYSINWDKIDRAIVQDDIVLVYIGKQQFYFFPKKNFESTQDFETVKALAVEKVVKVIR